jgi:hypothetical protein
MDGHLYVWARRQEIDRELVRLALVAEARQALEEENVGGEHSHRDDGQGYEADQRE